MRVVRKNEALERCEDRAMVMIIGPAFTQVGSKELENLGRFNKALNTFTAQPMILIDFHNDSFNATALTNHLLEIKGCYKNLDILLPVHGSEMTFIGNITILNRLVSLPYISDILGDALVNLPYAVSTEEFLSSIGDGLMHSENQNPANI